MISFLLPLIVLAVFVYALYAVLRHRLNRACRNIDIEDSRAASAWLAENVPSVLPSVLAEQSSRPSSNDPFRTFV